MVQERASDFSMGSLGKKVQFPGIASESMKVQNMVLRITKHGDGTAFQALFNLMYRPLCQFCVRIVGVNEVAE